MDLSELERINEYEWQVKKTQNMVVPVRIFGSAKLIKEMDEKVREQATNVACFPGIVKASLAMPDAHWGYGFPIGGVAALDPKKGVVSVGGVGFDGGCGVRTLITNLIMAEVKPRIKELVNILFRLVPAGLGSRGEISLSDNELDELFRNGAKWVVERGYGTKEDSINTENGGCLEGGEPANVSKTARQREERQIGTLGSGNHYLEIQYVDLIFDEDAAKKFGLNKDQVLVSIHCGSRALGHQIATDYLPKLAEASRKYGIKIRDRELVCAPIDSPEGKEYLSAQFCAMNYSYANRQVIAHLVRKGFKEIFPDSELKTFWCLSHNSARFEYHEVDHEVKELLVHRKGATRAFGPRRQELPDKYKEVGQPVVIGGTMGTSSYILCGTDAGMKSAFGSACHGAGRAMSRTQAKKKWRGEDLTRELERRGIYVKCHSWSGLAEEAPEAYKDVEEIIDACQYAGIAAKVVRMKPIGTIKG